LNATAEKFGYPDTLVREYGHWLVLVRPQQVSLGSLVLVCKEPVTRFSEVSRAAFTELHDVIAAAEGALSSLYSYDRINYLMLMMVDPDVHYHVIPRYEAARLLGTVEIADHGWPGPPALGEFHELDAAEREALLGQLREAWS
jgi:diadenosine tetraphosphate (Ap4A) HIT family hydrolase